MFAVSLLVLVGGLGIVGYGLLTKSIKSGTANIIIAASLAIFWVLSDLVEPRVAHRFDGINEVQKSAYLKYIILDLVGYAGIAYFLFDTGTNGSNGLLGAALYVVVMRPKRDSQQIFYGIKDPTAEDEEETEDETVEELPSADVTADESPSTEETPQIEEQPQADQAAEPVSEEPKEEP